MKKLITILVMLSVTFTVNAQRPRGKVTQSSRPRTTQRSTQRSTQRKTTNTRQNTTNKLYSCPDNKHPHLIDLGLPSGTRWACCNVGANKPEEYGGYYAWGEIEEKEIYREVNYDYKAKFLDVAMEDQIARLWAGDPVQIDWRMPTMDQFKELVENCKYEWTTINGINGGKFTGPNGRSIFLPAEGMKDYDRIIDVGEWGRYWSTTIYKDDRNYARQLSFSPTYHSYNGINSRAHGISVRPVDR